MFELEIFGQRIKEQRRKKKLPQQAIADLLGVNKTRVSAMERGTATTSFARLVQLADYFEVSTDYLLGRTDNPAVNR